MTRMFDLLETALAAPLSRPVIDDLREALHRLAGTAAFFGKAELGTTAAALDERLGRLTATPEMLEEARTALRQAANGGR
ncbi:Hpt domain-containing protein [Sphingomonas sp. MMS24-J45]|uniref:Hpt domain-containing protein n=1 Tax=Sphingomonas sp. MMS24-J45 TaxID=3238806 RepID=UPI0038506478